MMSSNTKNTSGELKNARPAKFLLLQFMIQFYRTMQKIIVTIQVAYFHEMDCLKLEFSNSCRKTISSSLSLWSGICYP